MIHNHYNYDDERTDRTWRLFKIFFWVLLVLACIFFFGGLIYLVNQFIHEKWD